MAFKWRHIDGEWQIVQVSMDMSGSGESEPDALGHPPSLSSIYGNHLPPTPTDSSNYLQFSSSSHLSPLFQSPLPSDRQDECSRFQPVGASTPNPLAFACLSPSFPNSMSIFSDDHMPPSLRTIPNSQAQSISPSLPPSLRTIANSRPSLPSSFLPPSLRTTLSQSTQQQQQHSSRQSPLVGSQAAYAYCTGGVPGSPDQSSLLFSSPSTPHPCQSPAPRGGWSTHAYCTGGSADLPRPSTTQDQRRSARESTSRDQRRSARESTSLDAGSTAVDSYTRPKSPAVAPEVIYISDDEDPILIISEDEEEEVTISEENIHKQVAAKSKEFKCGQCGDVFRLLSDLITHRQNCYPDQLPTMQEYSNDIVRRHTASTAMNGAVRYIRFTPVNPPVQPIDFLNSIRAQIEDTIDTLLNGCTECKVHPVMALRILQIDPVEGDILRSEQQLFSLPAEVINSDTFFDYVLSGLLKIIEEFIQNGSNWIIETVEFFDLRVTQYHSVPHKRGHGFFQLPNRLKLKQAVINVDNGPSNDNCFLYAILSVLHYDDVPINRRRPSAYTKWIGELNFEGLTMPMTAAQIPRFERQNPGLFINLLEWDESREEHPLRMLRACGYPQKQMDNGVEMKLINILVVELNDKKTPAHYVGIVHLNRLLNSTDQTHWGFRHCERCLQPFKTDSLLDNHRAYCYTGQPETLIPSTEKRHHVFEKWQAIQRLPYVVYADIECFLEPNDHRDTMGYMRTHKAAAISYLLVAHPDMKATPLKQVYRVFEGTNCILNCMTSLTGLAKKVYAWNVENAHQPVFLTSSEKRLHERAMQCYLCKTQFDYSDASKKKMKVREHDHLTGRYRGPACQECNGKMRLRENFLPVFFHNFRGYDSHVLCAEALGKIPGWDVSVIAQTKERYMAMDAEFEVKPASDDKKQKAVNMKLGFRDSLQFLTDSLDNLVQNLNPSQMEITRQLFSSDNDFNSIARSKGVFPYCYLSGPDKLDETSLPPIEDFYDELTQTSCTAERYRKAQEAWQRLKCTTFRDYMLNYLRLDVYQLADVFETFRRLTLDQDGLDPVYYLTLPGLSWDSAFKMTGARVDLLKDADSYCFVEEGIRGGMTFVNTHHVASNTPRIPDMWDETQPEVDLLYVDANNLYGNALSQKLPQSNFEWLDQPEDINITTFDYDGDIGHIWEVDLHYPVAVQDETCDLPLAPEKCSLQDYCLTDFMREQWRHLNGEKDRTYRGCQKLMLTHWDKNNYVIHGKLLQFYVRKGLVITRIHRILQFRQADFFRPYIAFNSSKRAATSNKFEQDFYKLKNNALFGKTMENVRKRLKFRLCTTKETLMTYSSRAEFKSSVVFNENLIGVHLSKDQVILDKPIFIGQAVLDLSKLVMYQLYYDTLSTMATRFNGRIEILGGDTDSFFLKSVNIDVEKELLPLLCHEGILDTSNYPSSHPLYTNDRKARLGCIKDENKGTPFREWVLLRPKAYSMLSVDGAQINRAKGVRRSTLRMEISYALYKQAYEKQTTFRHVQRRIGSINHQMYNITYSKRTLSFFEDKRAWTSINKSLPFGNHQLASVKKPEKRRAKVIPRLLEPAAKRPCINSK